MGSPRPAKSVRKLTTRTVVSKKFWVAKRGVLSRALSQRMCSVSIDISAEDSGLYGSLTSTNSMAGFLSFSARKQTHEHSDDEQRDDANSDIQRTDFVHQPIFFRSGTCNGRCGRRRRVFSRQHRLGILQTLERVVVLRVDS